MVNIYLDVNILVDLIGKREFGIEKMIGNNDTLTSTLSIHILIYVMETKIPEKIVNKLITGIKIIDFDKKIMSLSLIGPTADFEDNVQLNSAVEGGCDYFLTMDNKLLKLKEYKGVKIVDHLN